VREQILNRRVKRLTAACFYMCLVSGVTIALTFDHFDWLSMLIKGGVTLTTIYLLYLRSTALKSKRSLR
jgi:cytochrome b subunit of formate dehydrogenase